MSYGAGQPYNPYNQRGANPNPAPVQQQQNYYSPTYGSLAYGTPNSPGIQNQPKAYEGGRLNNGYGNGNVNVGGGYQPTQGTPFELDHDHDVHYHPPAQENCCGSLVCLLVLDLIFLLMFTSDMIRWAVLQWPWWFAAGFLILAFFFNIYMLVIACGRTRNNTTKTMMTVYSIVRILVGLLALAVSIIFLVYAIIFWTKDGTSGELKGFEEMGYYIIGWLSFGIFIEFLVFAIWFLVTIMAFNKAKTLHHTNIASLF